MYKIVWHFDNTTLSSVYGDKDTMEDFFEEIKDNLTKGVRWHCLGDTIVNANMALCITKGEDDEEWKSVKSH